MNCSTQPICHTLTCMRRRKVTFQRAVNAIEDPPTTIVPCTKDSEDATPEFGLCVKDGDSGELVASEKYVTSMHDKGAAKALMKLSQYHTFTPLCTIRTMVG